MADEVKLNVPLFHKRARVLIDSWKASRLSDDWQSADCILVVSGPANEDAAVYGKTSAVQISLLGFEFQDTAFVVTGDKVAFLTSPKKGEILAALKATDVDNAVDVEIFTYKREKKDQDNSAENKPAFDQFLAVIRPDGQSPKVGVIAKDEYEIKEWKKYLASSGVKLDTVDVSMGLSNVLAVKDDDAVNTVKTAARVAGHVMDKWALERILDAIDGGNKMTHEKIANAITAAVEGTDKKFKWPSDVDKDSVEECYAPIIQSGGTYDLKATAKSNKEALHGGTIVCSLGARYKSMCSNVGRTLLIDPSKTKRGNYAFLLQLQDHLLKNVIKDGVEGKQVYEQAISYIKEHKADLEQYFVKNCGFSMGAELRESAYILNSKCERKLKDHMVLNLSLGFQNVPEPTARDAKSKVYSLLLADTVLVNKEDATILTTNSKKDEESVCFYFEEEEKDRKENKQPNGEDRAKSKATAILPTRTRNEAKRDEMDVGVEARRREHQKKLAEAIQRQGEEKYREGAEKAKGEEVVVKRVESYKRPEQIPSSKHVQILVDPAHQSVLLPVFGVPVPFHIALIKTVTKSEEGEYTVLRFNFASPGVAGKKQELPYVDDPNATFIRTMAFRSTETARFDGIHRQITELKKEYTKREAEAKERADLVEQVKLQEMRGRRPFILKDTFIRPQPESRRQPGELEIHTNGLRYQTTLKQDHRIDINFSNIKHFFFQPCDKELFVLLHCHLKHPIMIGKKKTRDVQFYREVSDAAFDETGNRRRRNNYGDEDELQAEEDERRRRKALNREFKEFAAKIEEQAKSQGLDLNAQIPVRNAGFKGVAFRELVRFMPTEHCLVQLSEMPNLVIDLAEVEKVHLERVQFGLKNFDMVFIFKDYTRPVSHINSIPTQELEHVKEWLDDSDIAFSEGPVNLVWTQIMKTVNEDPSAFFKEGGWSFLETEDNGDGSDVESEESEYNESDEGSEEESESEDSESDFDEDASDEEDESGEEDDESGEDWDELEKKAKRADEKKDSKRRNASDDDDDRPKKKKK